MLESTLSRFIDKIEFTDNCWIWKGASTKRGYPNFKLRTRHIVLAHRQAYEWWVGPLIEGLTIDHLCGKIKCVNPDHLEQVTKLENMFRYSGATLTHCAHGHERSLYGRKTSKNVQYCLMCLNNYNQLSVHYQLNKECRDESQSHL